MLVGWPEQKSQIPIPNRYYWNYWDEISLHNGSLFKRQRIISPKMIRPEIIARSHSSLLGIKLCLRKAQDLEEGVEKKIKLKRQKAKSYYDRSAHPLPQLEVGQEVRVAHLKKGQS